jgi:hypothetical protein
MPRRPRAKKREGKRPGIISVFPTQLKLGDRISTETGEWEFAGPMHTSNFGKNVHAVFHSVLQPDVLQTHTFDAHERIAVTRE